MERWNGVDACVRGVLVNSTQAIYLFLNYYLNRKWDCHGDDIELSSLSLSLISKFPLRSDLPSVDVTS